MSTRSSPTDKSKPTKKSTEKSTGKVYHIDQDATEAAYRQGNHEVDRMVTEADFER